MFRPLSLFLISTAFALAQTPANNTLTPAEKSAGWKLLFDGKTTANWDDPAKKTPAGDAWGIEDGCLKAKSKPHIDEDLLSQATYRDFELVWDWKISPGGNSGVKYRIQQLIPMQKGSAYVGAKKFEDQVHMELRDHPTTRANETSEYVVGFEYQMIDNGKHKDALRGPKYQSAALYDMVPPSADVTKPVGEFNHSRLVVKGNHIEHWLNGTKVVDSSLDDASVGQGTAKRWGTDSPIYHMLTTQPKEDCRISLQNHGDEAWFRNIKIRELN